MAQWINKLIEEIADMGPLLQVWYAFLLIFFVTGAVTFIITFK